MGGSRKKLLALGLALLMGGALPGLLGAAPDTVVMDELGDLYGPVTFDHNFHVMITGSCVTCHHHTLGEAPVDERCLRCHQGGSPAGAVACKDCHPQDRFSSAYLEKLEQDPYLYHTGRPGLLGALHQQCLGCHQQFGVAYGCTDCHVRTEKGDAFYRSGDYAPQGGSDDKH
ncbi:cytochrome c3 family protein [Desulfurivibrio sp. D14AmB]|uniref:cytochrome c3 family protein n=1 Tax=Desulfurivibrio sp. D14AmB TaxID=3374370 RepID=UPI00376EA97F